MCIPIFDTGSPSHASYLNQLIDPSIPSCDYTHLVGSNYSGGDYQQITNSSLSSCIKSCCSDINCLAYTFQNGTCSLKNSIPSLNKTNDNTVVSGTVNHNVSKAAAATCTVPNCPTPKCNGKHGTDKGTEKKLGVPNLESIFYEWDDDTSQTSIAYKTCFETINNNDTPSSRSLYITVFPNGIHLTSAGYQQLLIQINGNLQPYMIPPAIRGGETTLRSYKFNDEGNKVPTITSQDGIIYSTPLSSCTDEFRHRFEYFTLPPRLPVSSSRLGSSEQCNYYKTTQYKCMPFNQLRDLSGAYVIPGNKTLDTILYEQQQQQRAQNIQDGGDMKSMTNTLTTEQIEGIIAGFAGVTIATIIILKVGSWISNHA
jgi:hypothetical protein